MSAPMPDEAPVTTAVEDGDGGEAACVEHISSGYAQISAIAGAFAASPLFGRPYISSMVDSTL